MEIIKKNQRIEMIKVMEGLSTWNGEGKEGLRKNVSKDLKERKQYRNERKWKGWMEEESMF